MAAVYATDVYFLRSIRLGTVLMYSLFSRKERIEKRILSLV